MKRALLALALVASLAAAAPAQTPEDLLPTRLPAAPAWEAVAGAIQTDLHSVCFADPLHGWAVGNGGAIWGTLDGGRTWESQVSHTPVALADVAFRSLLEGWAVGQKGTVLATRDGGAHWEPVAFPSQENLNRVMVDGPRLIIAGDSGLAWNWDGQGWHASNVGGVPCYGGTLNGPQNVLLVGGRSVVYETRFGNYVSWASRLTQKRQPSGIFLSVDGGNQFERVPTTCRDPLYSVSAAGNLAVAVGGDVRMSRDWLKGKNASYGYPAVLTSQDGGRTWQEGRIEHNVAGNLLSTWVWPGCTAWAVGFEQQQNMPFLPIQVDLPTLPVFLYSMDAGRTWTRQDWPGLKTLEHVFFLDPWHGWGVGPRGAVEVYRPTWRVELLYNAHRYVDAMEELKRLGPGAPVHLQALLLARTGQPEAARTMLADVPMGDLDSIYLRAALEYQARDAAAAMRDITIVTRYQPDFADGFYLRALLTQASDQPALARPYFERYLLLRPDGPHAAAARAHLLQP